MVVSVMSGAQVFRVERIKDEKNGKIKCNELYKGMSLNPVFKYYM